MNFRQRIISLITLSLLTGFAGIGLAQEPQKDKQREGERQRTEATSLTGCLAKGETADQYVLTDSKAGTKTTVTASSGVDIDKHAANHTVKLTGSKRADGTFVATGVEHISATCATQK